MSNGPAREKVSFRPGIQRPVSKIIIINSTFHFDSFSFFFRFVLFFPVYWIFTPFVPAVASVHKAEGTRLPERKKKK